MWDFTKPEMDLRRYGRHIGKSMWRNNSVADSPIRKKFGSRVQNHMKMLTKRSRTKPDVEFQYGSFLFWETGSRNTSAVNWDILSKFCTEIVLSVNKPETGCRFMTPLPPSWKPIWRHNSGVDGPIWNEISLTFQWYVNHSKRPL